MEKLGNRAGGDCNGYFATPTTGVSGFDSRQERNLLKLNGEHRQKTVATNSPAVVSFVVWVKTIQPVV